MVVRKKKLVFLENFYEKFFQDYLFKLVISR